MKSHKTEHMAVSIDHKASNNDNSSYAMVAKSGENAPSQNMNSWIGPFKNGKPQKSNKREDYSNYPNNKYSTNYRYNHYENTSAGSYNQYKTKPTTIKGSNSNSPLAVAPRGHWAKVFATGFPTDTTKYNVKKDLEYNIEYYTGKKIEIQLDELETRYKTYKSFKISCFCVESEIFMDNRIWPENILVKWFKERRPPTNGPNQRPYH